MSEASRDWPGQYTIRRTNLGTTVRNSIQRITRLHTFHCESQQKFCGWGGPISKIWRRRGEWRSIATRCAAERIVRCSKVTYASSCIGDCIEIAKTSFTRSWTIFPNLLRRGTCVSTEKLDSLKLMCGMLSLLDSPSALFLHIQSNARIR